MVAKDTVGTGHTVVRFEEQTRPDDRLLPFTYPIYHPLIRTLRKKDRIVGRHSKGAYAIVALADERLVGMVLLYLDWVSFGCAHVLSVFVHPLARGRGIGRGLLVRAQELFGGGMNRDLLAIYGVSWGGKNENTISRLLARNGWDAPKTNQYVGRFNPREALQHSIFSQTIATRLSKDFDVVPWSSLSDIDIAKMRRSNRRKHWIERGLEPWNWENTLFDACSRAMVTPDGTIVGWVLVQAVSLSNLHFICSFVRRDHAQRGLIQPIWRSAIQAAADANKDVCTFSTYRFHDLYAFLRSRQSRLPFVEVTAVHSTRWRTNYWRRVPTIILDALVYCCYCGKRRRTERSSSLPSRF